VVLVFCEFEAGYYVVGILDAVFEGPVSEEHEAEFLFHAYGARLHVSGLPLDKVEELIRLVFVIDFLTVLLLRSRRLI
jgi:hypothetical protein